jgi:hypothetical protein
MTKSRGINRPKHIWTEAERETLRQLYPDMRAEDVAQSMGMRASQIYRMAANLGLEKSEAFKASDKSGRVARGRMHPSMIASRFQPGLTPWNKGTNYVAGGRSAETRFQKGRKPQESRNYQPIGSLRITEDGWLERKVTDDQSIYPARRWVALHRLVWEAANGPIPAGHIVCFKPGMKTAIEAEVTADKLICITRAENARRNSIWRKDPELARLYQLKGAITRQVNRIKEETKHEQPAH